ncbi:MAG: endonuclease [Bacteroidales bacterium]|nr:endonuclease [Candidatus Cacconaster merdequi]
MPALKTWSGPYYKWDDLRSYFASLCGYRNLRLLYWNIQNGMWDGQDDNYDRFVAWVSSRNPDICVWCEGQSIYYNGTADYMKPQERYLVDGWKELAARYGHQYVYVGGHRDSYPQVITSRYPIENVERIVGAEPDSVVTHGAGWATMDVFGKKLNIVTLHTWPQKWAYRATDQEASRNANEGDKYRRMEIEYICNHTILTHPDSADEYWMMMGDHNARSRVDNDFYNYPEDDTRFLVHDFILNSTPYVDVIKDRYPKKFISSTHGQSRIDFVYLSPALNKKVVDASIIYDSYTEPVRNPAHVSNFWHPSDHRPIIVDFQL